MILHDHHGVSNPSEQKGYGLLRKEALLDSRLSYRARGILAYLLCTDDLGHTDSNHLAQYGKEGRDAVRSALKELEELGYIYRKRVQNPSTGMWSTVTTVTDHVGGNTR